MRIRVRARSMVLLALGPSIALAEPNAPAPGTAPSPSEVPAKAESDAAQPSAAAPASDARSEEAADADPAGSDDSGADESSKGSDTSEPSGATASAQKSDTKNGEPKGGEEEGKKPQSKKVVNEGPAVPLSSFLTLQLMIDGTWYDDPGYGAFSDNRDFTVAGMGLGADVVQLDPVTLAVELGLQAGAAESDVGASGFLQPRLGVTRYTAGILARYAIFPVFGARVRLTGGVDEVRTAFNLYDSERVRQDEWLFVGAASAGLELVTPPSRISRSRSWFNSVAGGLAVEGGYSFAPAIDISLPDVAANEQGDPPIRQVGADLGAIERSGPMLRVSLFVRL